MNDKPPEDDNAEESDGEVEMTETNGNLCFLKDLISKIKKNNKWLQLRLSPFFKNTTHRHSLEKWSCMDLHPVCGCRALFKGF